MPEKGPMVNGIRKYTTSSGEVRYEAKVWVKRHPITGKSVTKTKAGFRTQREAKDWKRKMEEQLTKGVQIDDRTRFGDYLMHWLENNVPHTNRSYELYKNLCEWYILPCLGDVLIRDLTSTMIQEFYTYLLTEGSISERRKGKPLGAWTVIKVHGILSRALALAVRRRIIPFSPVEGVEPPRQPKRQDKGWTPEQAIQFLRYVKSIKHRLYPLFFIALSVGARPGELCGLRWSDVDLKRGTIHIARGLKKGGKQPEFTDLKNENSERILPLTDQAIALLKALREEQEDEKRRRAGQYHDLGMVFATQNGTPYLKDNVRRDLNKLSVQAGVPKLSPHGLRHTFKSTADALDVDLRAIQDTMGHASLQTTERYGRRVSPKARQAISAVASVLEAVERDPGPDQPEELDRTGT